MKKLMMAMGSIICLAVLLSFITIRHANQPTPTVHITTGYISGVKSLTSNIVAYKGIPYAQPPVGQLRWTAPKLATPWTGVRACTQFGPSPYQGTPVPFSMWSEEFLIPKAPVSEDCLYLNVWAEAPPVRKKKPVLVWIYGGGFNSGGSAVPIYDGEAMARKGIVFVSFNYRVGVFGFFAHPELTRESAHHSSGNYGLLDQVAALQWVHQNIAAFGGDPNNVTIAGQSAGSMSVNCLMASPLTKNLFQKAIAESGAMVAGTERNENTLQHEEQHGLELAQQLHATTITDLRNLPAEQLQNTAKGYNKVIVDGYVLPESVHDCFAAGRQHQVPLLTGWNENEGFLYGSLQNAAGFKNLAQTLFSNQASVFLKFYPADDEAQAKQSQYNFGRDQHFGMQNYLLANQQSTSGQQQIYVYRFTRKLPATGAYVGYGAFHTGEVPYVYDNLKFVNRPWEPVDHKLAHTLSAYWANFVKTGNPNSNGLPSWPAYNTQNHQTMILSEQPHAQQMPDKEALDLLLRKWNK
ncbi:carboxylesterase family protein [Mucilaginibacter robiniae]|uniref:Carboxylic ester hydrolase n=1 Tax=Mucilaginibacter robiniae TaxID=2728022 RepID=A0A7L5E1B4_9SPHI|nr:carboxylesterase family protein [Mucilaginibacter robiniae]QJD96821.1 carboxylesterase family protein [Mucilaginibacter robiniae]